MADLNSTRSSVTVVGDTSLSALTGVRLEVVTDPALPLGGPGLQDINGNFVLAELTVSAVPP